MKQEDNHSFVYPLYSSFTYTEDGKTKDSDMNNNNHPLNESDLDVFRTELGLLKVVSKHLPSVTFLKDLLVTFIIPIFFLYSTKG